ncbi:hypothetical protein [Paenibacillus polymyxa]|uniref:Uncharacterized protein n=1 Tax=Paenibacillus polymyxa TaxID=1406 RepID=A0A378XVG6_PAEPO|nr:hypothetical protein [Paenibacillus polymyxa]MBE7897085.1 hypothetical protein [Paenibacillus polymyxa]MBG9762944.1 hypothetical protein [Paenibacillus polymyxa]MCC3257668.1 hypothetical protein [Paenibacillus polymyxa]QPK55995.1 hypothetical protein G7035_26965 [Paenibacillus polymyxa]QPK61076.1 hypothetical protein G7L40_26880 [Paenibacillus polymyxa]
MDKNKVMKIIVTTASILLIIGVSSALKNNVDLKSKEENETFESSPETLEDTLTWDLAGDKVDPEKDYSVTVGYPHIKLNAKNTGAHSFRIEVKHNSKNTVIFNASVAADATVELVNNDSMPLVPSGAYTVTIYGGTGLPKGQVLLTQSKAPY